jgi:hypothetical protein
VIAEQEAFGDMVTELSVSGGLIINSAGNTWIANTGLIEPYTPTNTKGVPGN